MLDKAKMQRIQHPAPQASIFFAQHGVKMDDPDVLKAAVMMYILGASQAARLSNEVREKRGLAYTITANIRPYLESGLISGYCGTKKESADESVALIQNEWKRMRATGPTENELKDAKLYLIGSYPLQFTSTSDIATLLVNYQMSGKSIDYFHKRDRLINALTAADIKAISQKLLKPESLTFVVVGAHSEQK